MSLEDYNGSIGLPICSTDVSLKNDLEENVILGEIGEICIKGPQVMLGYWQREEETKNVFTKDGYLKTGDLGIMNSDGFITIVDRKKDMIIVSGFKVFPTEVEEVIAHHPKVFESAVVGIPDDKTGEAVKLFIVKKDQTLSAEEILKFCRENLTNYKVPKAIEFRTELPKSNVGKILRKDLR
jgi:long-chain acyl-CoA synthetase